MDRLILNPWFWWAAVIDNKQFTSLRDAKIYLCFNKGMFEDEALTFLNKLPIQTEAEDWLVPN